MNPRHAKVAWIYFIGVAIIIIGVYIFAFYPEMEIVTFDSGFILTGFMFSFVIMLAGLLVTGIGAIHGKRKLREIIIQEYEKGPAPAYTAPGEGPKAESSPQEKTSPQTAETGQMPVEGAATPDPVEQAPQTQEEKPQEIREEEEPEAQRVIKVLICTKCGAENKERNIFCYHCGKKLRIKKSFNL